MKVMVSDGYSLWIMPKDDLYNRFSSLIKKLAREYNAPVFQPHVTLLGEPPQGEEEMIRLTEELTAGQNPFPVILGPIDYQDYHFKALFVRARITKPLLNLHEKAKKLFNMQGIPPYIPHLSLLYGDYPNSLKEEIITKIGREQPGQFEADKVYLVKGGQVDEWKIIKEFGFV